MTCIELKLPVVETLLAVFSKPLIIAMMNGQKNKKPQQKCQDLNQQDDKPGYVVE